MAEKRIDIMGLIAIEKQLLWVKVRLRLRQHTT